MTRFKQNLLLLMESHGHSTRRLCEELNIPVSTLHGWKEGASSLVLERLQQIAARYEVTLDHLLFGDVASANQRHSPCPVNTCPGSITLSLTCAENLETTKRKQMTTELEQITLDERLVPAVLTKHTRGGTAMRTESIDGFCVPQARLKVGTSLWFYGVALDPATRAAGGFREFTTSRIVSISAKGSVIITTENSTYLLIYKKVGA